MDSRRVDLELYRKNAEKWFSPLAASSAGEIEEERQRLKNESSRRILDSVDDGGQNGKQ